MAYPGGKGGAFRHIINRIPPHRVYVESHLGGGAVLRKKRPASHSVGIDLDSSVFQQLGSRENFTAICGDAADILPRLALTPDDFVYCDPPYRRETRKGGRLYRFEADDDHHHRLLDVIRNLRCQVMISGYANSMYDQALKNWRSESFFVASRAGRRRETVWMNYDVSTLHDTSYIGSDFRQREQFRRKRNRWKNQFHRLPLHLQQAIAEDLSVHVARQAVRDGAGRARAINPTFQLYQPGFDRCDLLSEL